MSRPIELGPDPTILGDHFCGGQLREYADQGSLAKVAGHTLAQCTVCGDLTVIAARERDTPVENAWWRQ